MLKGGAILAFGAAVFAVTLMVSFAGVSRNTRPQLALTVVPVDAGARAKLASQLVTIDDAKPTARALALDALRRDPIQPVALRVLAQSLSDDDAKAGITALQLMTQSERLTRRDVLTQMWFVDHFGRQGNVELMVAHFDNILRSSEQARAGAFPMLALAASADPKAEKVILDRLAKRPNWANEFATFAIGSGSDLDFANSVAQLLLDVDDSKDRELYVTLLNRFAEIGRYASAWELYRDRGLVAPSEAQKRIRNGNFEGSGERFPFDWTFRQEPELWSNREKADNSSGFVLQLGAMNGRSGVVASQVLHLAPGNYRMALRMGNVPTDKFEKPVLRLDCVAGGSTAQLVSLVPDRSGTGPFDLGSPFVVPQNCTFQRLSISVAGDGPQPSVVPWVDDIRID